MPLNNPSGTALDVTTGTYTGNASADRAIPHSLGKTPKLVFVRNGDEVNFIFASAAVKYIPNGNAYVVAAMTSTNFYVGDAASYAETANANAQAYTWIAMG